jgi:hypothetical protein
MAMSRGRPMVPCLLSTTFGSPGPVASFDQDGDKARDRDDTRSGFQIRFHTLLASTGLASEAAESLI